MASRTTSSTRRRTTGGRSQRARPLRALIILACLIAAGVLVVVLMSDFFERGIREVTLPLRHENIIRQQAEEKGVDAALIAAVIYTESRFVDQTSEADARGLMQITPTTANDIERLSGGTSFELEDLSDPDINIRYGTFYLAHLLDIYDGDVVAALAAYNAGPGNAERWGGSEMTIDDITYPETKAYVEKVLEKQREYRHIYDLELGY
jgi:soluble lytic murein transglycosylase